MTDVALKIGGQEYVDFLGVTVRYSMEAFARDFTLTFSDKFLNDLKTLGDLPFVEGDSCQISFDGEVVLDGFIDEVPASYDDKSHELQVTGRSWHGHLVDSSAVHKTGHWKDAKLLQVCQDVTQPFGAKVAFDPLTVLPFDPAQTEKFRRWAIEDEETVQDFIARACRMRGIFAIPDAGKTVVLTKASKLPSGAILSRGPIGNILRGSRNGRYRERYSDYIVMSQSAGFDDWYGEDAAQKGVYIAKDEDIETYRPLVIISDGQGTKKELELRANWERNVRAGRSRRLVYDVQGVQKYGDFGGGVWKLNETVIVNDDYFGVTGSVLLIIGVTLNYSNSGTITTLEVGASEQFDIITPPKKRPKFKKGRSFL